jgi:DNA-binding response OmpR family regulator
MSQIDDRSSSHQQRPTLLILFADAGEPLEAAVRRAQPSVLITESRTAPVDVPTLHVGLGGGPDAAFPLPSRLTELFAAVRAALRRAC